MKSKHRYQWLKEKQHRWTHFIKLNEDGKQLEEQMLSLIEWLANIIKEYIKYDRHTF